MHESEDSAHIYIGLMRQIENIEKYLSSNPKQKNWGMNVDEGARRLIEKFRELNGLALALEEDEDNFIGFW